MSKFHILWIDDQKVKCKRDVIKVKRIIDSLGFEPDISIEDDISDESLNNENGKLNKAIRSRNVDLFVIDYNLKNDIFGNDVVEKIRENNDIYTDIVFYSSDSNKLVTAVKKSFDSESSIDFFDGVYIAPLGDDFTEKIRSVIVKIIKSWYNVHSIRGIVLSKASKIEQMVSEIISSNYKTCLDKLKKDLIIKGECVCNTTKEKWKSIQGKSDPIPYVIDDPIGFNWKVKEKLLKSICEEKIVVIETWGEIKEIFELRNDFAHNPAHLEEGVLVLQKKTEKKVFTEEKIDSIRAMLTKIENDLEKIISSRKKQVDDKKEFNAELVYF